MALFPEDSVERKTYPIFSGLLQYFPSALAAIAHHSFVSNGRHNPGQPLHHDRAKSDDEPDALMRHLMEGDYVGMAWRALSLLQKDLEAKGAPIAPGARNASPSGSRIATPAELDNLRDLLTAEELKGFGIGDVPEKLYVLPDMKQLLSGAGDISRHPMNAESVCNHDERLHGAEDRL